MKSRFPGRRCLLLSVLSVTWLTSACDSGPESGTDIVTDVKALQGSEQLFFASDVHQNDPSSSQISILQGLLGKACPSRSCSLAALVGDHGKDVRGQTHIHTTIKKALLAAAGAALLTQGNNDATPTSDTDIQAGGAVSLSGNQFYDVYVINVTDFEQGTAASSLATYFNAPDLNRVANGKIHYVLSHYPLHSAENSSIQSQVWNIFLTLQDLGQMYPFVFLWGHDHKAGHEAYDVDINRVNTPHNIMAKPGVSPSDPHLNQTAWIPLAFTYVNAGYISPVSGTSAAATRFTASAGSIALQKYGYYSDAAQVNRNWVQASGGAIVSGAYAAGTENGKTMYPCRAQYASGLQVGRVGGNFTACKFGWGSSEVNITPYEVLANLPTTAVWQSPGDVVVPFASTPAGFEGGGGQRLYICRAHASDGNTYLGKVRYELGGCRVGLNGSEINYASYEVLSFMAETQG